jgi:hypothetical protein
VPRSFFNSRDSETCSEDHRRIHGIECDGVEAAHVEAQSTFKAWAAPRAACVPRSRFSSIPARGQRVTF